MAKTRRYRAANRERLNQLRRERYVGNSKIQEYQRAYRASHREQINKYMRQYLRKRRRLVRQQRATAQQGQENQ
jgi:hypothetical protein